MPLKTVMVYWVDQENLRKEPLGILTERRKSERDNNNAIACCAWPGKYSPKRRAGEKDSHRRLRLIPASKAFVDGLLPSQERYDEPGDRFGVVQVEDGDVEVERFVAGHRRQAEIVPFAAADERAVEFLPMDFDLREEAPPEPFDEDKIHVAEMALEQFVDQG